MGLSVTAYGNIERNDSGLTFERLEQIADALEVAVQHILNIPEQLSVHSVVNSHVRFNCYDNRTVADNELAGYKQTLENAQKEIDYLRQQNQQLMDLLSKKFT